MLLAATFRTVKRGAVVQPTYWAGMLHVGQRDITATCREMRGNLPALGYHPSCRERVVAWQAAGLASRFTWGAFHRGRRDPIRDGRRLRLEPARPGQDRRNISALTTLTPF